MPGGVGAVSVDPDSDGSTSSLTPPTDSTPFVWRPVECGRVVAISAENPFPGNAADWAWLFNSLDERDWMWYRRHGFSNYRENEDFWALMVPGVGGAPVNSFLVLISLFVIGIGPINYVFLRRKRQLHLLLLVVPAAAALVTAALFLYALLDDGLGVRGRARTLTTLDQHNRRVVSWARHAYYAGLAPSVGLTYSNDAVVHTMDYLPGDNSSSSRPR